MKIEKKISKKTFEKTFYKYVITLPENVLQKAGLEENKLKIEIKKGEIIIKKSLQ